MYNHASDDTTRFIGFGLAPYALRIQLMETADNVTFRCGTGQDTEQELMRINGNLTNSGGVTIYHTAASSSSSTGALVVNGGIGAAGALYVGGKANVATAPSASNDVVRLVDIGGAVFSSTTASGQWGQGGSGSAATVYCQKVGHAVTVSQKSLAASYTIQTTSDYLRLYQGDLPAIYRPDDTGFQFFIVASVGGSYTACMLEIEVTGEIRVYTQTRGLFSAGTAIQIPPWSVTFYV